MEQPCKMRKSHARGKSALILAVSLCVTVVCGAADSEDAVDIGEAAFFHLQSFLIVVIILFHGPLVSPENMRIPEGIQRKDE